MACRPNYTSGYSTIYILQLQSDYSSGHSLTLSSHRTPGCPGNVYIQTQKPSKYKKWRGFTHSSSSSSSTCKTSWLVVARLAVAKLSPRQTGKDHATWVEGGIARMQHSKIPNDILPPSTSWHNTRPDCLLKISCPNHKVCKTTCVQNYLRVKLLACNDSTNLTSTFSWQCWATTTGH